MRWVGNVTIQKCINEFGRKTSEGKRLLGRPRHRLENNIRMGLMEIE
jgi:hypothetical protein